MFRSFIFVLSQIKNNKKVKTVIDNIGIDFEASCNQKFWIVSTSLYHTRKEKLPLSVQQCVFSCGILHWQNFGPYLKLDTEKQGIKLIEQIKAPDSFIAFRAAIKNFIILAKEWEETLQELAKKDSYPEDSRKALNSF